MKYLLFTALLFLFACSENTETQAYVPTSSNIIESSNKELLRTFKGDYSHWKNDNGTESYEDLRFKLGFYGSFNEMRQAQYRKMGIVTDLSQIQNIIDSGKPTFIEGWSESCVYCKMGEVALKKLKVEHSNQVNFVIVDVSNRYLEDVTETLRYFQISSTPTYIILDKNGEETYRSVGYAAEGEKLSKILYENY
tara:strand:- start:172 stop:753 length:582 start_codon:yes stop_codon:yes gene_type:complete